MASKNDKQPRPEAGDQHRHSNPFVYYGTIVLLVITVVAFVLVPSFGSLGSAGGDLSFGSWNGKPIAFVQGGYFSDQVSSIKAQYEAQGYKDSGDQFFAYQVWRSAFENTAVHLALLDYARRAGISATDGYLSARMLESQAFFENGAFSRRAFREASDTYKIALRKQIYESTLKQRYVSDVVSVVPSEAEKAFVKSMAVSERIVEYVALPFSAYPDSERLAFAQSSPDLFRRLTLSRVTMSSSRKDAEEVLVQVRSGALSFEEAAKNHSKDAYAAKGGDMGSIYFWELKGDLKDAAGLDAVASLAKGELSDVYETVAGSWTFFRVNDAAAAAVLDSSDTLKSASEYLNRYEKGRIEDWVIASAKAFKASAQSGFAAAAAAAGLAVKETNSFPLNYGAAFDLGYFSLIGALDTTDKPELRGADRNEAFLAAVFSAEAGAVADPVVLNDYAVVARVKEIRTADESSTSLLAAYYPNVIQQSLSEEVSAGILASPELKDNFLAAFTTAFAQSN